MPRKSRQISPFNYYHIVARGNNKQDLFFDQMDFNKFMKELINTKEKYNYCLYAYVLMPNHIHICIKDNEKNISKVMHSLLVSYAEYYNKKYERTGYVFQDRFYSEPITSDNHLKNVVRYIHLNPEKAGIQKYNQYKWSSYNEYLIKDKKIVDKKEILNIFSEEENSLILFNKFHNEKENINILKELVKYEAKSKLEDKELYEILLSIYSNEEVQNLTRLNKVSLKPYLKEIFEIIGTNNAQISRVTGVNLQLIRSIKKELKYIENR